MALPHRRWDIEVLFKVMKRTLQLFDLLGFSAHAVRMGRFRYEHDKGVIRSGNRDNYKKVVIPFDAAKLNAGENRITMALDLPPPSGIKPNFPYCSVMFDCIRFEAGAPVTSAVPSYLNLEPSETGYTWMARGARLSTICRSARSYLFGVRCRLM